VEERIIWWHTQCLFMNDKADTCEPVFDKLLSKNEQPNPTIHDLVSRQLASPRLRRLHVDSTLRNWRSSLAFYGDVLKRFTPENLLSEGMFDLFLDGIEACLRRTELAVSTVDNYTQVLHGNLLVLADVNERVRQDVKQGIRNLRKKQKKVVESPQPINDEVIVKWLKSLDGYCEDPKSAPNLFKLGRKTSKMAYKNEMSMHHMLLLRGYVWLTLATGARSGEIRGLTTDDISDKEVTRTVYKMKVVGQSVTSELPEFIQARIRPMLASIKEHAPQAELLFCEHENKKGKGTIDPRLLQEMVKGSMIAAGMPPTTPGGYYRLHDLRKVWARWIDENGGSLEAISSFLGHSSTQVTYNAYFHAEHKRTLAREGQQKGLDHLRSLLAPPPENLRERMEELRRILAEGGSIYEELSFSLRHNIERTKASRASGMALVPAPRLELGTP